MVRSGAALALAACLLLAGCGTAPSDDTATEATVTPAPVPGESTVTGTVAPLSAVSLQPTCERPPGRVVAISIAALRSDDRDAGIATAWQFTAPSTRRRLGSQEALRDVVETSYGDLLNATRVEYAPTIVVGTEAQRLVRIDPSDGDSATFRWVLERQRGGRYDGCWMTTRITRERDLEAGERP